MFGLAAPFFRIPLQFNAAELEAEVAAIDRSEWRPDRFGISGYLSLNLVSYRGADGDRQAAPWQACARLQRLPQISACLRAFEAPFSEVRLRCMAPGTTVPPHFDASFYWVDRMRFHVPVTTAAGVEFRCDGEVVGMRAGECWLFDRLRLHTVENASNIERIHLIIDTVGSPSLTAKMAAAEAYIAGRFVANVWREPVRLGVSGESVALPGEMISAFTADLHARACAAGILDRDAFAAIGKMLCELRASWEAAGDRREALARATIEHARVADTPHSTALEPSVARRIEFFVRSLFDPNRQRLTAFEPGRSRYELPGDLVFHYESGCGFRRIDDDTVIELPELMLLCGLAAGEAPVEVCDRAGVVWGEEAIEVIDTFVECGWLEVRGLPVAWDPPSALDPVIPADTRTAELPSVTAQSLVVRVHTSGMVGVWSAARACYVTVPPRFVGVLAELVDGASFEAACQSVGIANNAVAARFANHCIDAGILEST